VGACGGADPAEGRDDPHGVEGGQTELRARRGRRRDGLRVESIEAVHKNGERRTFAGDYFFSTMPMRELVRAMDMPVPANVLEVSDGLQYRDFITVGLLGRPAEGEGAGRRAAEGHVDLYPGAGCAAGTATNLQQLESVPGERPREGMDRARILLLRDRRPVEDAGRRV
jgi:hypothetical protein